MTSEWVSIFIGIFGGLVTALIAYIRTLNKNDILRSELKQKEDTISELREERRILWDRTQRTK